MSNLSFLTLDQLMSSIESDLSVYADNGMINRGSVIKIVKRVNEDLGLKINKEKQCVVDICNYKGTLPDDFYKLQTAYIVSDCDTTHYHDPREILGTVTRDHSFATEEVPIEVTRNGNACLNQCGGCYWVTQLYKEKFVRYKTISPIRVTQRSYSSCTNDCSNLRMGSAEFELDIENGEVVTGMKDGNLYLNYLSQMIDEDNNILVLDHPMVRPYYEYAVKKHLMETWMINNDADVSQKLMYYKQELMQARIEAITFVSIFEPSEIRGIFQANRRRFYNRYFSQID